MSKGTPKIASIVDLSLINRFLSLFLLLIIFTILSPRQLASVELENVFIVSSYDSVLVHSLIMIPTDYDSTVPAPVLFIFHGANSTNANDLVRRFRYEANSRGWIIAAPDMHGENILTGQFSFGARAAQHDVIDLLQYLRDHYNIDNDRLYLTGPSMGGGMTSVTAEKYPDVFTAAVEWMGYADMTKLHSEMALRELDNPLEGIEAELGGTPDEVPYEYDRRSPDRMAMNLKYVPFAIGHGENDSTIGPWHALQLASAIESYDPLYFRGIYWHEGGHVLLDEHIVWICDYLDDWTRVPPPEDLFMQVDESKDYYYVDIVQEDSEAWSIFTVDVSLSDSVGIDLQNVRAMTLHIEETNIDPNREISLTLFPEAQHSLTLTGLVDTMNYALSYEGEEYGTYTYENGILTIEIPGGSPEVMTFLITPQG